MFVPFLSARGSSFVRRKGGGGGGAHPGGGGAHPGGGSAHPGSGSAHPADAHPGDPGESTPKSGGTSGGGASGAGGGPGGSGGSGSGSGGANDDQGRPGNIGTPGTSIPLSGSAKPGGKSSATAYGGGGGHSTTIPSGQPFSGRSEGGGTRSEIFGSSTYGSGYPGLSGRGVVGRGFPFYFWPVVWGGATGSGAAYLYDEEYGDASNSSRPGGSIAQGTFTSAGFNSTTANTTFHILADDTTVTSLVSSIQYNCTTGSSLYVPYNASDPSSPQPEQAVQYYRASSVVLTLDGYNNTAVLSDDENTPDTPLPSNIDMTLFECLNQTIGLAVPLIDGADARWTAPGSSMGMIGIFWVFWCLSTLI